MALFKEMNPGEELFHPNLLVPVVDFGKPRLDGPPMIGNWRKQEKLLTYPIEVPPRMASPWMIPFMKRAGARDKRRSKPPRDVVLQDG